MTLSEMSGIGSSGLPMLECLLADITVFEHLGSRIRPDDGTRASQGLVTVLAVATVVIVALWLLSRFTRLRENRHKHSPKLLLKELTRAHRLSGRSIRLMKQVAADAKLENPLRLFVDPKWLEAAQTSDRFRSRQQELASLRVKLFGSKEKK